MNFRKQQGSALLFVLIIAFVLMTIILGVAYKSKINNLTTESLSDQLNNNVTARNYLQHYLANNVTEEDISSGSSVMIGEFTHNVTFTNTNFVNNNNDRLSYSLENAGQYYAGFQVSRGSNFQVDYTMTNSDNKTLINKHNLATRDTHGDFQIYTSTDNIQPIIIPYVDVGILDASQLNSSGGLNNTTVGYVGAIELSSGKDSLTFYDINGNAYSMTIPTDTKADELTYISVGLELVSGDWNIYFATSYEYYSKSQRISYSVTSLSNVLSSTVTAVTDLTNYQIVQKTISGAYTTSTGNSNQEFDIKWINSPSGLKLFLLYNTSSKSNMDMREFAFSNNVLRYVSEVSYSKYSNDRYVIVKQPPGGLQQNDVLIISDVEGSGNRNVSVSDVNYGVVFKDLNRKPELAYINGKYMLVTIENGDVKLYDYDVSSISADSALSLLQTISIEDGIPIKIIIRYGFYFIVTSTKVYAYDSDFALKDSVFISLSDNIEILYDTTENRFYALPNALNCRLTDSCNDNDRVYFADELLSDSGFNLFYSRDV
jgi:hypothetical protein